MLFSLNSEGNGHFCPHQREVTPSKNVYFFYQDGNVKMVCLLIVASEWVLTGENVILVMIDFKVGPSVWCLEAKI
jgi:hypothetical protein